MILTLSWRTSLSYINHQIDFISKSMDWFLYAGDLRQELRLLTKLYHSIIFPILGIWNSGVKKPN